MMVFCCIVFSVLLLILSIMLFSGKLPEKLKSALHMDLQKNTLHSKKYAWCLGGFILPGSIIFLSAALSEPFRQGAFLMIGIIWIAAVIVGISAADRFFHKDDSP